MVPRFLSLPQFTCLLLLLAVSVNSATAIDLPDGIIELPARAAPHLVLANMDGESYDITSARGQWAFVHFWASWCRPCRREIPSIQTLIRDMKNQPVHIVVINTAETADQVFEFLAAVAPDINSLLDEDGLATEAWQPRGLPSTYLVDPKGMIRYVVLGGRPWDSKPYQEFLKKLIRQ